MAFQIIVRQSAVGGLPIGDAFITFIFNDRHISCRLDDFKEWVDEIYNSNGNRNKKAYEAKDNLEGVFNELLYPFVVKKEVE